MDEKGIEKYLTSCIQRDMHGKCYKFVSPGNDGVPDRIIILPSGNVVFAELKADGGKLSKLQQRQLKQLRRLGQKSAVVIGKGGAVRLIAWLAVGYVEDFWAGKTYVFSDKYICELEQLEKMRGADGI